MSLRVMTEEEVEQQIALRVAAEQLSESIAWLKKARDRLMIANKRSPLPEGALDIDLDLIGCQKTLARVRDGLASLGEGKAVES